MLLLPGHGHTVGHNACPVQQRRVAGPLLHAQVCQLCERERLDRVHQRHLVCRRWCVFTLYNCGASEKVRRLYIHAVLSARDGVLFLPAVPPGLGVVAGAGGVLGGHGHTGRVFVREG